MYYCDVVNGSLANVNGEAIYLSDINDTKMFLQYYNNDDNKKNVINDDEILDKLIRNKLINTHYRSLLEDPNIKMQIESQMKYVKKAILDQARNILERYFFNDEKAFYKELGCSVDDYVENNLNSQKDQMITTLITQKLINSDRISPKKLREFYDNMSNKEKDELKNKKNSYIICELVLKNKESEDVLGLIKDIQNKIKNNPNDFDNIIREYSNEDINLGDIDILEYEHPLSFYIAKLKEGEVSDIIKIDDAYYLLKCNKRNENIRNISCLTLYNNLYNKDSIKALEFLNSIKNDIKNNKISWHQAVYKYSQNNDNKNFSGTILNKDNNDILFDEDLSEKELEMIANLKTGDISEPFFETVNDEKVYKILFLKKKIDKDDISFENNFNKIKEIYQSKQNDVFFRKKTDKLLLTDSIEIDLGYDICKTYLQKLKNN